MPRFGWSEQRPQDWWEGTKATIREVVGMVEGAAGRVAAICSCGQMHGSVLIDDDGSPTLQAVPLWNDKRTAPQVERFIAGSGAGRGLEITANMPSPAWPAFKIAWIAEGQPDALARASTLLMPKDWINFKLTGERAQDFTEASLSYLMDWRRRCWSEEMCELTGVPVSLLAPLKSPADVLGKLQPDIAADLGLAAGIPVLVGAGDYPMALLGSGVTRSGMGSDVTGTSSIITLLHDEALPDQELANVLTPNGVWGVMTPLTLAATRCAGHAVLFTKTAVATKMSPRLRCGRARCRRVVFLPYLSGERVAAGPIPELSSWPQRQYRPCRTAPRRA